MTILSALYNRYRSMEEIGCAPPVGYSNEKISFSMVIDTEGRPVRLADKRSVDGGTPRPVMMYVPEAVNRTRGVLPNRFWDKAEYVLGMVGSEVKLMDGTTKIVPEANNNTIMKHEAFVDAHLNSWIEEQDVGLEALRKFLKSWRKEQFEELGFSNDALSCNIVFELENIGYIHDRPAIRNLFKSIGSDEKGVCLVTGKSGAVRRLHPKIKGIIGGQSSGTTIVSFNERAYESFGKSQGANAPISEEVATAYGVVLNELLSKGSGRRTQILDTTVAYWADAACFQSSEHCENLMEMSMTPPDSDTESEKLRSNMETIAMGRVTEHGLDPKTKIYVLGMSANAARVSVRYWCPGTMAEFAANVCQFWNDMAIIPNPFMCVPSARTVLRGAATSDGKGKAVWSSISPQLGGQVMRSILTGAPLPSTLLHTVVTRFRMPPQKVTKERDRNRSQWLEGCRAAICRAVINRINNTGVVPMSLDTESTDVAYRLGRLFAMLEKAQARALPTLNAPIKDRYFAAASATPARVFPLLIRNANHHLALLKKGESGKLGYWFENQIGDIWQELDANLPRALSLQDQGRFIAGYYHQYYQRSTDKQPEEEN